METVKIDQGMRAGGWGDLSFALSLSCSLSLSVSWFCLIDSYVFQSLNTLALITYLLSFFCSCNTITLHYINTHLCNMDMHQNNACVFFNCFADAGLLLVAAVSTSCPAIELMFLVTGVTLSRMMHCIFLQTYFSLLFSHSHLWI